MSYSRIATLLLLFFACLPPTVSQALSPVEQPANEMVRLLERLHQYSQEKAPSFQLIGNGALDLLSPGVLDEPDRRRVAASLDGIMTESLFYGWEMKDDEASPPAVLVEWSAALKTAADNGLTVFNIDYCSTPANRRDSDRKNRDQRLISFAAPSRQLTKLGEPRSASRANVATLQQVTSFQILLNPEEFSSRTTYLQALAGSRCDLLLIDPTYNGSPLTANEVNALKRKPQGGQRLVFAYLSIGEAENYRSYWQPSWTAQPPDWLVAQNPDWDGNFKVRYWQTDWQNILFGSPSSQLDRILAAGFNGAMLDVVDAYQFFVESPAPAL